MKQVKCVITDDEPTACEGLQRYVEKVDFLSLIKGGKTKRVNMWSA